MVSSRKFCNDANPALRGAVRLFAGLAFGGHVYGGFSGGQNDQDGGVEFSSEKMQPERVWISDEATSEINWRQ